MTYQTGMSSYICWYYSTANDHDNDDDGSGGSG